MPEDKLGLLDLPNYWIRQARTRRLYHAFPVRLDACSRNGSL